MSPVVRSIVVIGLLGSIHCVARAQSCIGDCDGNGTVTVDELVRGVSLALALPVSSPCPAVDENGDQRVLVNELVAAVNAALCGCGQLCPTPLPTRSFTATSASTTTATATPTSQPPTSTPTPTATRPPAGCSRVQQGTWCLSVGDVLAIEDQLTQSGCVIQLGDPSLRGPISGDCWTVDNRQFDVTLTCCFFDGDPAMQCEGSADVQGTEVDVMGYAGCCEDECGG